MPHQARAPIDWRPILLPSIPVAAIGLVIAVFAVQSRKPYTPPPLDYSMPAPPAVAASTPPERPAPELDPNSSSYDVAASIARRTQVHMAKRGYDDIFIAYPDGVEIQLGSGTDDYEGMTGAEAMVGVLANYRPGIAWRCMASRGAVIVYEARYNPQTHRVTGR